MTLSDYSSRAATFAARPGISHQRSITGLDGPSASARFGHSFPQPKDVGGSDDGNDNEVDRVTDSDSVEARGEEAAEHGEEQMNRLEAQSTTAGAADDTLGGTASNEEPSNPKAKGRPRLKARLSSPGSKDRASTSSFVTAPTKSRKPFKPRLGSVKSAQSQRPSFVTAVEPPTVESKEAQVTTSSSGKDSVQVHVNRADSLDTPISNTEPPSSGGDVANQGNNADSTTHLLPHESEENGDSSSLVLPPQSPIAIDAATQPQIAASRGRVRFNVANTNATKAEEAGRRKIWRRLRQGSTHPGEIVKMEKMLVRVDSTMQELPSDYNENDSLKTESRTIEKWREFVVVCRESTVQNSDFLIQLYKTRKIPSKEKTDVKKHSTHEIHLNRKNTRVNLYSTLDKTLVVWLPWKIGTIIYILRTHSIASAVEWYTFLRHGLGASRSTNLDVNVPDLSVSLHLKNPFEDLEAAINSGAAKADDAMITRTADAERAVANTIIQRSLKMLGNNPEWADVLGAWLAKEKIGLAWKRYDRLEWIHGANEQRMYGTIGMQQTHELELRPKEHYPTHIISRNEGMDEPAPVEGFLIRLTSQKGRVRRLGKMYFKRLYFTTHNQFLCYCRPAKALPPAPPKMSLAENAKVPSASEIVDKTPLIYAVNPYPNKDGQIEWVQQGTPASRQRHDDDAFNEAERKINSVLQAEGYVNLSHVIRVQDASRGNSPADANVDQGPDVNFHEEVDDSRTEDGKTDQFDDKRTFELVMKNKLIIRLQAYNEVTKKEWVTRLQKLMVYWKVRLRDDMDTLKAVRQLNLKRLEIDEESEASLGQFGSKWEVTRSVASPKLFNMCGISCCRAIIVR